MKRRMLAVFICACILLMSLGATAMATDAKEVETRSTGTVSGGLAPLGGNSYEFWAKITGNVSDTLSITAYLYRGNSYVTSVSGSGSGPYIFASKDLTLSSGSYRIELYGQTPTHSPSGTVYINI